MTTPAIHRIHAASPRRRSPRPGRDPLPGLRLSLRSAPGGEANCEDLGRGQGAPRRQGRQPGGDDPARAAGAPGFTVTTEACSAFLGDGQLAEGLWEQEVAALHQLETADRQALRRPGQSAARLLPLGREVLDAGDDGHRPQHRAERRGRWRASRRSPATRASPGTPTGGWSRCSARWCSASVDEPFEARALEWRAPARRGERRRPRRRRTCGRSPGASRRIVREQSGREFPDDPMEQLRLATRGGVPLVEGQARAGLPRAAGIPHDLGTAVNIVAMVFGNMGRGSATGVATTRNVSTGEHALEGDYLLNAQGEDVVAGTRADAAHRQAGRADAGGLHRAATHRQAAREALPRGAGHRVHRGARHALDAADARRQAHRPRRGAHRGGPGEGEAASRARRRCCGSLPSTSTSSSTRSSPRSRCAAARSEGRLLASGLNVSPGAAVGQLAFDADTAERWAKEKKAVIMIRRRDQAGRRARHARRAGHPHQPRRTDEPRRAGGAAVRQARGGGRDGAGGRCREEARPASSGPRRVLREGDWVSIDGTTGEVFVGQLETMHAGSSRTRTARAARLGGRVPPPGRVRERRLPAGRPARTGAAAPRASACAAPSTCSSRPSGCPLVQR